MQLQELIYVHQTERPDLRVQKIVTLTCIQSADKSMRFDKSEPLYFVFRTTEFEFRSML